MDTLSITALASAIIAFLLGIMLTGVVCQRRSHSQLQDRRRLESELTRATSEVDMLRSQSQSWREKREDRSETESNTSSKTIAQLMQQLDELKQKYQALRSKWEQERNQFAQIIRKKNGLLATHNQSAPERPSDREAQLTDRIAQLEATLADRDQAIASLQSAQSLPSDRVDNVRLSEVEKERADLLRKISAVDALRATDATDLAELRRELAMRNAQSNATRTELGELQDTVAKLNSQLDHQRETLSALHAERSAEKAELIAARTQLAEQLSARDNAQSEALGALEREHAQLAKEHDEAIENLNQMVILEAQCDRMKRGMESLERRLDDSTEALHTAREELAHKNARLEELEALSDARRNNATPSEAAYANQDEKLRALWWENKKLRAELEKHQLTSDRPAVITESDQVSTLRSELSLLRSELVTLQNAKRGVQRNSGHASELHAKGYVPL